MHLRFRCRHFDQCRNDVVLRLLPLSGGMLWFTDLTVPDSSLALPIIWTICTYTGVELSKMKGATGWIKVCRVHNFT